MKSQRSWWYIFIDVQFSLLLTACRNAMLCNISVHTDCLYACCLYVHCNAHYLSYVDAMYAAVGCEKVSCLICSEESWFCVQLVQILAQEVIACYIWCNTWGEVIACYTWCITWGEVIACYTWCITWWTPVEEISLCDEEILRDQCILHSNLPVQAFYVTGQILTWLFMSFHQCDIAGLLMFVITFFFPMGSLMIIEFWIIYHLNQ